jgi:hypothetical protein
MYVYLSRVEGDTMYYNCITMRQREASVEVSCTSHLPHANFYFVPSVVCVYAKTVCSIEV